MNVKAKDMNFKNMESLKPVENVINEARKGINDRSQVIVNSSIPDVLGAAAGAVAGGGISFAALYFGGKVVGLSAPAITSGLAAAGSVIGGGMLEGVFVLAAPVAVLSVAGYATVSGIKRQKLKEKKVELLSEVKDTLHDVQIALERERADATKERKEYLNSLIVLLESAIKSLRQDLEKA